MDRHSPPGRPAARRLPQPFRGFGVDLADLREYQYHDDVRHIDWNVTARLQTPYVRVYNEDRDVTAWFLLDLSPSVSFGSERVPKRSVAIEFVTVLSRLLSRQGNPIGALFYGDRVDTVIPARSGRRHVLHILSRMLAQPERRRSAPTNLKDVCQPAARPCRGDHSCSSSPTSSAPPVGRSLWRTWPGGTRSWPCGSTTRSKCSFRT